MSIRSLLLYSSDIDYQDLQAQSILFTDSTTQLAFQHNGGQYGQSENVSYLQCDNSGIPYNPLFSGCIYHLPTISGASDVTLLTDQSSITNLGNPLTINNVSYSWPGSQGAANTFLRNDGAGALTWVANGSGSGDVSSNIASSTLNALAVFADTSGKLITEQTSIIASASTVAINPSGTISFKGVAYTWPALQGGASTYLKNDGTGALSWDTISSLGDVVGPASSVDGRVACFDGVTGKLLKQSDTAYNVNLDGSTLNITASPGGIVQNSANNMVVNSSQAYNHNAREIVNTCSTYYALTAETGVSLINNTSGAMTLLQNSGSQLRIETATIPADISVVSNSVMSLNAESSLNLQSNTSNATMTAVAGQCNLNAGTSCNVAATTGMNLSNATSGNIAIQNNGTDNINVACANGSLNTSSALDTTFATTGTGGINLNCADNKISLNGFQSFGSTQSGIVLSPGSGCWVECNGDFVLNNVLKTALIDGLTASAAIAFNNNVLSSVADPSSPQDVATKNYVDTAVCDRDLKENIKPLVLPDVFDKIKLYRYNYKGNKDPHIGVMAQEIAALYPDLNGVLWGKNEKGIHWVSKFYFDFIIIDRLQKINNGECLKAGPVADQLTMRLKQQEEVIHDLNARDIKRCAAIEELTKRLEALENKFKILTKKLVTKPNPKKDDLTKSMGVDDDLELL